MMMEETRGLVGRKGRGQWRTLGVVLCCVSLSLMAMSSSSGGGGGAFSSALLSSQTTLEEEVESSVGSSVESSVESSERRLVVSGGRCSEGALRWYSFEGSDGSLETLAKPGCGVSATYEGISSVSRWRLRRVGGGGNGTVVRRGSSSALVTLWRPGLYRLTAEDLNSKNATVLLRCAYVRKEIRSLDDEERFAYLQAVEAVYSWDGDEGRAVFGPRFFSATELVARHLFYAGDRSGDAMHDGLGFLPQHMAISNVFEKALQAVDPTVALPYWDFTADLLAEDDDAEGCSAALRKGNPELFAENNGLLSRLPVMPAGPSPYGKLRSPWNLNDAPNVSRYDGLCGVPNSLSDWPRCETHKAVVFDTKTLPSFSRLIMNRAHGIVHLVLGGVTGCDASKYLKAAAAAMEDRQQKTATMKDIKTMIQLMWRSEVLNMPESCQENNNSSCAYACFAAADNKTAWDEALVKKPALASDTVGLNQFPRVAKDAMIDLVCDPSQQWKWGDQAGAESPVDPSFWPMHPTLERLYHYKRLVHADLVMSFDEPPHTGWSVCEFESFGDPCFGHRENDTTFFTVPPTNDDDQGEATPLTNLEVLAKANPRDYSLDYIYDSFSWPHCDHTDAPFPSLVEASS